MRLYKGFWAAVYILSGEIRAVTYADDEAMARQLLLSSYTDRSKALLSVEPVDVSVKAVDQYAVKPGIWVDRQGGDPVRVLSSDTDAQGLVSLQDDVGERTMRVVDFVAQYYKDATQYPLM